MSTPIRWNDEFRLHTFTANDQSQPVVTALADGRFVAIWTDKSATLGDPGSAIHGQIFNADGSKSGAEFLVNAASTNIENTPAVTALDDGGFAVAWQSDGFGAGIRGQMFHEDGSKSGSEFPVDLSLAFQPSMTALANHHILATWASSGDVHAQMYLADGTKSGAEFVVNSVNAGTQSDPSAALLSDDRFVVTWTTVDANNAHNIHAQIFNSNGSKSGTEFTATTSLTGHEDRSTVTALEGGRFVVAWEHTDAAGDTDIYARIFNADGSKLGGDDFRVHATHDGDQSEISFAALHDGGFVAVWTDSEAGQTDIRAQAFHADGTRSGGEFVVNTHLADIQEDPTVTVLADGRFVVAWTDQNVGGDNDGFTVRAQIFDPRESGMTINGTMLKDDLVGTNFNDVIKGAGGDDRLFGSFGDDLLIGGDGADTLVGGSGSDTASYVNSASAVLVNLASNINTGGEAQGDMLYSIDNVIGSNYNDYLTGNNADNILEGGLGADTMNGGLGADTASYRTSTDYVIVNLASGVGAHGDAQGDALSNIENLIGSNYADILSGNASANAIEGGGGNDQIFGGGGDDTAVFSHNFNDYTVIDYGFWIRVIGPDGTDTLSSIEHLRFADTTITPFDDGNPLFDTLYYLSRNADVFQAGINALDHFNAYGWHEGRDPNPYFDTSGYLAVNKDVAAAGLNPLDHYHQSGWHEGRDPSADFDTTLYLIHNPDVASLGIDPLAHYLHAGFAEGRQAYAAIGTAVNGFDAEYYLLHNTDVAAAGVDPLAHFNQFGWHEGRNPNAWFDTAGYLAHYGDVAAAGINPLQHYEQYGWLEGRDPSAGFDTLKYLAANPDVAAAHINPLDHFINNGIYEGRTAINDGLWH